MTKKCLLSVFIFLFSLAPLAIAQNASTSLRGVVKDPSGAVVPGAAITLTDPANGAVLKAVTNNGGEYQFSQIPPAKYTIAISANGFADQTKTAELLVSQPATINFTVSVNVAAVTVDVTGEANSLNSTDATIGTAFNQAQIQTLPFEGNNVLDLLALQAGVLFLGNNLTNGAEDSRQGVVNGARSDQSNVTLDGIDNNDQNNGYAFTGVLRANRDSVEEFRVTTTNANADNGRSSGAQVTLVTRSGTNKFHGSGYEYYRPTNTVANDWFNKQAQVSQGLPNTPPKLLRNTYGVSLGGPILKDKLFFFTSFEGQSTAESKQVFQTVPTESLKAGNVIYTGTDGNQHTLTPADIKKMDPNCSEAGTCPQGNGVNPSVLDLFSKFPKGNTTGGDGVNSTGYTFSSPNPIHLLTYIAKIDYNISSKDHVFARGNLQGDNSSSTLQFPGGLPTNTSYGNNKGIAAGYTRSFTPNLINNVRYGFVREGYADRGASTDSVVSFRSFSDLNAITRSTVVNVHVNNFSDDLSWTKGRHTLQFGGTLRAISNNRATDSINYNSGNVNYAWLANAGIANTSAPGAPTSLDPGAFGYTPVSSKTSYNNAISAITGLVDEGTGTYNYKVAGSGLSIIPSGTAIPRHFKSTEFEYYLQDTWKATPDLTLTFGIHHTILQVPYETNGQEVAPTFSLHDWFVNRGINMTKGLAVQPTISFAPSGKANKAPALWTKDKKDIAPRFSFAYSPHSDNGLLKKILGSAGKSSLRGGYGLYFDHFGTGIVNTFSQDGSFGLTTSLTNPSNVQTPDTSPRFTGLTSIPASLLGSSPNSGTFPVTPPSAADDINTGFAITYGLDDKLKTPYSHVFDLSFERELPGGFVMEFDYVGRLGRRLLQLKDLAMPLNLVDPKSGTDYFTAATQLSKYVDAGAISVPAIPYFENLFPTAAGVDQGDDGAVGNSATQNIYNDLWQFVRGNETAGLDYLDQLCYPGCANGQLYQYFDPQYSSLYAWSSSGTSSYHSVQIQLHHPMSHGVGFDFDYTFGKSLDQGSDTERSYGHGYNNTAIINSWNPKQSRSVSDFDVRHNISANWNLDLPFGKGRHFASGANRLVDTFIGGWQLSGLTHWSTGLPTNSYSPFGWSTNWELESFNVLTGKIKSGSHHYQPGTVPNLFSNPQDVIGKIRPAYPGETGQRNMFRGDGYFTVDSGLAKVWRTFEGQQLKFSWEVFNVTNSVRFDPEQTLTDYTVPTDFGTYTNLLTDHRVMQFSLRYSF